MDKIKNFILKYKIVLLIILLLIISFGIYLLASAEEDIYANQIKVNDDSISITVKDGTAPFDANNDPGNDASENNNIVRNFDSITYSISYSLMCKENSTVCNTSASGNAVIDVLLPSDITATVSDDTDANIGTGSSISTVNIGGVSYNYYPFTVRDVSLATERTSDIVLSNIVSTNGATIKPIIRVREEKDLDASEINENTDINSISNVNVPSITVSAAQNYKVKLYSGTPKKNYDTATIPVGVVVYLPKDPNKGMKGLEVPSTADFNISVAGNANFSILTGDDNKPTIGNYDSKNYTIDGLPTESNENGNAGISQTDANFALNFTELKYSSSKTITLNESDSDTVNYLSAKMLVFNVQRSEKTDINFTITETIDNSSTAILYNYDPYVGAYSTKIDFIDANRSTTSDDTTDAAVNSEKIYNFNEEFMIENKIEYGIGNYSGDALAGVTNYIKIDSDAIELLSYNEDKDYDINSSGNVILTPSTEGTEGNYTVQYGVGSWDTSSYTSDSTCTINNKQDLMNYYGGPCIKEDNIKWYNEYADAKKAGNIILIKFNYTGVFEPGAKVNLKFKAKVKNDSSKVKNYYSVISRGVTTWKDKTYYLSEKAQPELPDNVNKDTGDYNIYYDVDNNDPANKFGNRLRVSALKVGFTSFTITNFYDSEKTTIYSGLDDPIELTFVPSLSTYAENISFIYVNVWLPESLELYVKAGDKNAEKVTPESVDNVNYNMYSYKFTADEIKANNGKVPNLVVHAYVSIDAVDETSAKIIADMDGEVTDNNGKFQAYTVEPYDQRKIEKTITLRNNNLINSIGTIDKTYIDRNEEYIYKMKAANLSGNSAELELLNILPYSGDGKGSGSNFTGKLSVAISDVLPQGYKVYYTTDLQAEILSNEMSGSSKVTWKEWTNYNTYLDGVTAIKIVPSNEITENAYFGSKDGISLKIKTSGNNEANVYYNNFYILHKNTVLCMDDQTSEEDEDCNTNDKGTLVYPSNTSEVSVYNRKISGKAFEDEDLNGLYDANEKTLSNLIVELYKLNATSEFDSTKPVEVISDKDEKVSKSDTTTDKDGRYSFSSLTSGNYYVKITYDCDKYTVTTKNSTDSSNGIDDSDFAAISNSNSNVCSAVSNIITLNNENVDVKNIDLGLQIRQNFDIKVSKYITNVTINSNKGTESIDYDKQTKVKIDVKNLKNTSFRVTYKFEIENTKYFPGTIGTILESIPEGMTFDDSLAENDGWYQTSENTLYYQALSNTLIMPGEKYYITVVLDLVTDEGGDYVNIISVNDLNIMNSNTVVDTPNTEIDDSIIDDSDDGEVPTDPDDDYDDDFDDELDDDYDEEFEGD